MHRQKRANTLNPFGQLDRSGRTDRVERSRLCPKNITARRGVNRSIETDQWISGSGLVEWNFPKQITRLHGTA